MGIFSKVFGIEQSAKEIVGAVINTGDKLLYTDEEKAEMKLKVMEHFPTLLKSYEPFKLAQRILAFIFTGIFSFAFLTAIGMTIYNIIIKYQAEKLNVQNPILLDIKPIYDLVSGFGLDWIVLSIVSFYFCGGVIDSFRRTKA